MLVLGFPRPLSTHRLLPILSRRPRYIHRFVTKMAETPPIGSKVIIMGAGNFGSCLADHLAHTNAHFVSMWSREEDLVRHFNKTQRNLHYLKDHIFPSHIKAIGPALPTKQMIDRADVLLFALPTQALRDILEKLKPSLDEANLPLLIFVNKGIEIGTHALTLEIIADTCGPAIARAATFISGPSFAKEIVQRQPTSVSVASFQEEEAQKASDLFHQPYFRCYIGGDPIGLELAGALKNVYALAAGMADGLGFQNNTRAMLITRGLAEMTRIGAAYGADPMTFMGLSGVGDLFLTCSSPSSRNYTVGFRMGKGESLEEIVKTLGSVAEGVTTAKGLYSMIQHLEVHAPIATAIYEVLYEGVSVDVETKRLMALPPSRELSLPARAGEHALRLRNKLGL